MLSNEAESKRTVYACAATVLVGQDGILRPIVNRPCPAGAQSASRRVGNPPQDAILPHFRSIDFHFYVAHLFNSIVRRSRDRSATPCAREHTRRGQPPSATAPPSQ